MSAPYHAGKMGEDEEMEMGGARAETALTIYGGRSPDDLFEHFSLRSPSKLELGLHRRGGVVRVAHPLKRPAYCIVIFVIVVSGLVFALGVVGPL